MDVTLVHLKKMIDSKKKQRFLEGEKITLMKSSGFELETLKCMSLKGCGAFIRQPVNLMA